MTNADMPTAGRTPGEVTFERDPRYTDRSAVLADAQYARDLAIEALQNNRLELGAGFANLAVRAARYADRMPKGAGPRMINVPVLGATRDEQPRNTDNACTDEWQPPHAAGSHPDGCATCSTSRPVDLQEYRRAQSAVETATMPAQPPQSSRCQAVWRGEPCENVIYLEAATGKWTHLNPGLDVDHAPAPRERDGV